MRKKPLHSLGLFFSLVLVIFGHSYDATAQSGGYGVVALKSHVSTPAQLEGKKIAVHGSATNFLSDFLTHAKLKIPAVRIVPASAPEGMEVKGKGPAALFRDGKLDAAVVTMAEAMTLTLNDTIGDGTKGSVKDAILLKFDGQGDAKNPEGLGDNGKKSPDALNDNAESGSKTEKQKPKTGAGDTGAGTSPEDQAANKTTAIPGQNGEGSGINVQGLNPNGTNGSNNPNGIDNSGAGGSGGNPSGTGTGTGKKTGAGTGANGSGLGSPSLDSSTANGVDQTNNGPVANGTTQNDNAVNASANSASPTTTQSKWRKAISQLNPFSTATPAGAGNSGDQLNPSANFATDVASSPQNNSNGGSSIPAASGFGPTNGSSGSTPAISNNNFSTSGSNPTISFPDFNLNLSTTTQNAATKNGTTTTNANGAGKKNTIPPTPNNPNLQPLVDLGSTPTNPNLPVEPVAQMYKLQDQLDKIVKLNNACIQAREFFYGLPLPLEMAFSFYSKLLDVNFDLSWLKNTISAPMNFMMDSNPTSCPSSWDLETHVNANLNIYNACLACKQQCKDSCAPTPSWCFDPAQRATHSDLTPCKPKPDSCYSDCNKGCNVAGKCGDTHFKITNPFQIESDNSSEVLSGVFRQIEAMSTANNVAILDPSTISGGPVNLDDVVKDRAVYWRHQIDIITLIISGFDFDAAQKIGRPIYGISSPDSLISSVDSLKSGLKDLSDDMALDIMNLFLIETVAGDPLTTFLQGLVGTLSTDNLPHSWKDMICKPSPAGVRGDDQSGILGLLQNMSDQIYADLNSSLPTDQRLTDVITPANCDNATQNSSNSIDGINADINTFMNNSNDFGPGFNAFFKAFAGDGVSDSNDGNLNKFTDLLNSSSVLGHITTTAGLQFGDIVKFVVHVIQLRFGVPGAVGDLGALIMHLVVDPVIAIVTNLFTLIADLVTAIGDFVGAFASFGPDMITAIGKAISTGNSSHLQDPYNSLKDKLNSISKKIWNESDDVAQKGIIQMILYIPMQIVEIFGSFIMLPLSTLKAVFVMIRIFAKLIAIYEINKNIYALMVKALEYKRIHTIFTADKCLPGSVGTSIEAIAKIRDYLAEYHAWDNAQLASSPGQEKFPWAAYNALKDQFHTVYQRVEDNPCARKYNFNLLNYLEEAPQLPPYILR